MATLGTSDRASTAAALEEMVRDGLLTWAAATIMYREEFDLTYRQCTEDGVTDRLQDADANWRKKVLFIRANMHTLALVT